MAPQPKELFMTKNFAKFREMKTGFFSEKNDAFDSDRPVYSLQDFFQEESCLHFF